MDLVYYYWTTWLLILVRTSPTFYNPSSGDLDPRNKMTHVSLKLALLKAWMILSIMTTLDATMASYTTKIVGVLFWVYLHLQEVPPSLVKCIVDYGKFYKYGSSKWTLPGKCNIHYPCVATSTGCTAHVASDEINTCISWCSVCQPPTAEGRCNDLPTHRQCRPELTPSYICTTVRRRSRQFIYFWLYTTIDAARCLI